MYIFKTNQLLDSRCRVNKSLIFRQHFPFEMETSAFFVNTLIYLLLSAVTTALDEKDESIVFRAIVKRGDADLTLENFPNPRSDLMACRRDGKAGYFCDPGRVMADGEGKGFCQVERNKKIKEKLGSGWVGQAPTRI